MCDWEVCSLSMVNALSICITIFSDSAAVLVSLGKSKNLISSEVEYIGRSRISDSIGHEGANVEDSSVCVLMTCLLGIKFNRLPP